MLNDTKRQAIAAKFQSRLLDYRLANAAKVLDADFDVPGLSRNLRIVAQTLGACIVDAPELQTRIAPLLEGQQELVSSQRWINPQCVALEALLAHCHRDQGPIRVGVGEIAATANSIFADRSETTKLEAKTMGNLLRELQFNPKRDAGGYALRLTEDLRRQIHIRARDYQIVEDQRDANCSFCAEIAGGGAPGKNARVA